MLHSGVKPFQIQVFFLFFFRLKGRVLKTCSSELLVIQCISWRCDQKCGTLVHHKKIQKTTSTHYLATKLAQVYTVPELSQKIRGALGRFNSGTAQSKSHGWVRLTCIPDGMAHFEETKLEVLFEEVLHILKAPKTSRIRQLGGLALETHPQHKKVQATPLNFLKKNETTRKLGKRWWFQSFCWITVYFHHLLVGDDSHFGSCFFIWIKGNHQLALEKQGSTMNSLL